MTAPESDKAFPPGVALEGWLLNMQQGRSRTKAAQELASGLDLTRKGVADLAEMRSELAKLEVPAAGQEILNVLSLQEIIYSALAVKWGTGETRRLPRSVKFGTHTISVENVSKRSIAAAHGVEVGSISGIVAIACFIAVFDPAE
eukprot:3161551-Amphidinium_carterae.1